MLFLPFTLHTSLLISSCFSSGEMLFSLILVFGYVRCFFCVELDSTFLLLHFLELHYCTGAYRISPVDVNSRPSSCLTNFLLNGKFVSLANYFKVVNIASGTLWWLCIGKSLLHLLLFQFPSTERVGKSDEKRLTG